MSIAAVGPVEDMASANAALAAQGFGPGSNFTIPVYAGPRANHATLHAWPNTAFAAAVKAIPTVAVSEIEGEPQDRVADAVAKASPAATWGGNAKLLTVTVRVSMRPWLFSSVWWRDGWQSLYSLAFARQRPLPRHLTSCRRRARCTTCHGCPSGPARSQPPCRRSSPRFRAGTPGAYGAPGRWIDARQGRAGRRSSRAAPLIVSRSRSSGMAAISLDFVGGLDLARHTRHDADIAPRSP